MSAKTIYLVRHAQAEHNVACDYKLHDPLLTKLGEEQAAKLGEHTRDTIQPSVELLVTSPMKRTIQTTLIGCDSIVERIGRERIVLLPHAQESNNRIKQNTLHRDLLSSLHLQTHAIPALLSRISGQMIASTDAVDFSPLAQCPEWILPQGFFAPDIACLRARAKYVRRWLRSREQKTILLVTHGTFIRYLVKNGKNGGDYLFANAEIRSFTFKAEDDEDAWLVEKDFIDKTGTTQKTSDDM